MSHMLDGSEHLYVPVRGSEYERRRAGVTTADWVLKQPRLNHTGRQALAHTLLDRLGLLPETDHADPPEEG